MLPVPDNPISASKTKPVRPPIFCCVTDRHSLERGERSAEAALLETIQGAIAAGIDWIQIREKDLAAPKLLVLVKRAVLARESPIGCAQSSGPDSRRTRLIVNDRLDVALAAGADGVHLGRESLPLREVVRWARGGNVLPEFLIGASCHTLAEAREAEDAGASYVVFGPVFDTPSKRAFGPPTGIAQLSAVCAAVGMPVLAIGGVNAQNVAECVRAGAAGIAAIRIFQDAKNIVELRSAVEQLRENSAGSARR